MTRADPEYGHLIPLLEEYAASGKAVLIATHDRDLPAGRRIRLCVYQTQASPGARVAV